MRIWLRKGEDPISDERVAGAWRRHQIRQSKARKRPGGACRPHQGGQKKARQRRVGARSW